MPHCRAPKPGSRYYLPPDSFRVARAFCLNYENRKAELKALDGWHASSLDGQPRGTSISDAVAREGLKRAAISREIDIIEKTVMAVSGSVLYPFMLSWVTDDTCTFPMLEARGIPLSRNAAAKIRQRIYYTVYHNLV